MKKFFEWDENIKNWIGENRIKWCFILFGVGMGLSILYNSLLGSSINSYINIGLVFGTSLIFIELVAGGSGIED